MSADTTAKNAAADVDILGDEIIPIHRHVHTDKKHKTVAKTMCVSESSGQKGKRS